VDNDSRDGGRELIQSQFPQVRWIQMPYNSGFARANNEGIRQSAAPVVLLLNADTLIENLGIERCFESFQNSDFLACGVQLINPDRSPQISGNYFFTGGLNNLLPLPYMGEFLGWLGKNLKAGTPHVPEATGETEVDWINGAFLMVKKSALEKAGLMDEDFFMYAEEAEWCGRLRKWGKLCLFGSVRVIHLQGETANRIFGSEGKGYYGLFDKKGLQIMLSNFVRIRKQFGLFWFLVNLGFYVLELPVFLIGLLFSKLAKGRNSLYHFSMLWGYTRNLGRILSLCFTIMRNKPFFYKVL